MKSGASRKRRRSKEGDTQATDTQAAAPEVAEDAKCSSQQPMEFALAVRWHSPGGDKTMAHHLPLRPMGQAFDGLSSFSAGLMKRAYPANGVGERELPLFMTNDAMLRFTPSQHDGLQLPGIVEETEFRLIAIHDGWEYCVLYRKGSDAPQPEFTVSIVEWQGLDGGVLGLFRMRRQMVSYPVVAISKSPFITRRLQDFLELTEHQLRTDPAFKGILDAPPLLL